MAPKTQAPIGSGSGDKTRTTTTTRDNGVTALNHKLTTQLNDMKQNMTKIQDEHDKRVVDFHTQIHDLNKKLETVQKEIQTFLDHYHNVKKILNDKIDDQQKTINDQHKKIDGLTTTIELLSTKRARTV
jgi:hypothetical protein